MNKTRIIILTILLAIILSALIAYNYINTKMEVISGPTLPPFSSPTLSENAVAITPDSAEKSGDATPSSYPLVNQDSAPATVCGGPPQMIVLAIGTDNDAGYILGLADAIRVVKIDFVNPHISALSFPRDIWVPLSDEQALIERNITHSKLNQSYYYGNVYHFSGSGSGYLAQTLYDNFGVAPDHYVTINKSAFVDIVDAVGGIDIYLEEWVRDESEGNFRPGWHRLDGERALAFSRIRRQDSELARIDRGNQVLFALRERVLSPDILPRIPEIIDALAEHILTDISIEDMLRILCLATQTDSEDITSVTIPNEYLVPGYTNEEKPQWIWVIDPATVREYVTEFFYGDEQ